MLQYFETTTRPHTTVLQRHGQSCKATKASLFAKTAYNRITSYLWEGSCMHLFVLMFVHTHAPCLDFRDSESQLKTYHGKMGNDSVFAKSWKPRCILCTIYNVVNFGYSIQTRKEGGPKEVQNMNIDDIGNFWDRGLSVLKYLEMIQTLAFFTLQSYSNADHAFRRINNPRKEPSGWHSSRKEASP